MEDLAPRALAAAHLRHHIAGVCAQTAQCFLGGDGLSRRQDAERLDSGLPSRIQRSHVLDLIVKEEDAHGIGAGDRPNLDGVPAVGHGAGLDDLGHRVVAVLHQGRGERLLVEYLAHAEAERQVDERILAQQTQRESGWVRDHDARLVAVEAGGGVDACADDAGVWREALVRADVVPGQAVDQVTGAEVKANVLHQLRGHRSGWGDHERGAVDPLRDGPGHGTGAHAREVALSGPTRG